MVATDSTTIAQVVSLAKAFQTQLTGYAPAAVTVVLTGDTLVITLHEALTPAEKNVSS